MSGFERFVPEVDAPEGSKVERRVAVLVSARVVQRSSWSDEVEVSERVFTELASAEAPEPRLHAEGVARFRTLDPGSRGARPRKCGLCFASPGTEACRICDGTGRVYEGEDAMDCKYCDSGRRPCTTCDGTMLSVPVRVIYGEDRVREVPHMFLPAIPVALREPLAQFFRQRASVPDALRLDLDEDFAPADAYRGRRAQQEIHGHKADAALAGAKQYVARLRRLPSVVAMEERAYAWPFAVVGADDRSVIVIADEAGEGRLVEPAAPQAEES